MVEGRAQERGHDRLHFGLIGGGEGSFIGDVHRKAALFDDKAKLVAGCFSRDYANTLKTGKTLGLEEDRLYESFQQMAEREEDLDFVSIVTPNYAHYEAAEAFLKKGIPVVCDKPLTCSLEDAQKLSQLVKKKDLLFCVTYVYSGYPMVKEARAMVKRGDIGEIRMVAAEYPQEWLATPLEKTGQRQASWRTDPEMTGMANCVGDIGSHIENTVSYMTGLSIESLCAKLDIFGEGRSLDDNARILLDYTSNATGSYWCSQIAIGYDNGLKVRIFGTEGSLEWAQENPNYLQYTPLEGPKQTLSRGRDELSPPAQRYVRIPSGHPEGYYEAFANTYSSFLSALAKRKRGEVLVEEDLDFPSIEDGVKGVRFIHRCVESSQRGAIWVDF